MVRPTAKGKRRVRLTDATPNTPVIADVRYADGSSWDPGNGAGYYYYDGANWRKYGMSLGNNGYGWRDQLGNAGIRGNPSNSPTWAAWNGNIYQLQFGTGTKEMTFEFHIQHDFLTSADATAIGVTPELYLHTHWSTAASDSGDVKWYYDITYAKGYEQAAFPAAITTSVTQTHEGTALMHHIAEVKIATTSPSATELDYDTLEVDGLIIVRLYRNSADVADTITNAPFVHYTDLHYMTGDRTATKNRNTPFYA